MLATQYRFNDPSGTTRLESDELPQDGTAPTVGSDVLVQYRPGTASASRLVGHDHLIGTVVFLLALTGGLVLAPRPTSS